MPKIFIATPTMDMNVSAAYAVSMSQLAANAPCEINVPLGNYDGDLVRVRSRYVEDFLESDCSHLLFIDSDIEFSPAVVSGLLHSSLEYSDIECVNAPYRRKKENLEYPLLSIHDYNVKTTEKPNIIEIASIGLGMSLMTRGMLEKMREHYLASLAFNDIPRTDGKQRVTAALFMLSIVNGNLLGEDYSFFKRWRDIGGKVWLYLGDGSPVNHHGSHRFEGKTEHLSLIYSKITGDDLSIRAQQLGVAMGQLTNKKRWEIGIGLQLLTEADMKMSAMPADIIDLCLFQRSLEQGKFEELEKAIYAYLMTAKLPETK